MELKKQKLGSNTKFLQLDSKLGKNHFFSKSDLPRAIDARIFNIIKQKGEIPQKNQFPSLYHWFVFLKQFASSTLQKWISSQQLTEEEEELVTRVYQIFLQPAIAEKQNQNQKPFLRSKAKAFQHAELEDSQKLSQYKMILKTTKTLTLRDFEQKLNEIKGKEVYVKSIRIKKIANGPNQIHLQFISSINGSQLLKQTLSNWKDVISYENQLNQGFNKI